MKKKLSIFLWLFFSTLISYTQENFISGYVSRSWSNNDGLPSNVITSMIQDYRGYIYLGTYTGLVRFDGMRFCVVNKNTSGLFPFISARVVFEDKNKRLWIGSNGEGITFQNKDHTECESFSNGLPSNSIRSIIEAKNGDIWIGTSNGVACLKENGSLISMPPLRYDEYTDSTVVQLFCDIYGGIWCITSSGRVYRYQKESFVLYTPAFLEKNEVSAMFQDSEKNFWFGLRNNSVIKVKAIDGYFPSNNSTFETYTGKDGIISGCAVNVFMEDSTTAMWIGTDRGIFHISPAGKIEFYTEKEGLVNNRISSILQDREDNIWIGTDQGGIEKLTKVRFHSISTPDAVNCITEENGNGKIWIGTDRGLYCYTDHFIENNLTKACKDLRVRHLAWKKDGTLLVSTYSNSGQILAKDGKITSLNESNGLSSNRVRVALELSNGNIAIGTAKGLNIQDAATGKITSYTRINGLTNDFIMCLWEDPAGHLWIGTDGGGINLWENGTITGTFNTEKDGLAGDVIFKIFQDKNNVFWICTGTGISRYDGRTFFNYNMSNGLGNDSIFQILPDHSGITWIVSNGGISSVPMAQLEDLAAGVNTVLEVKQYNKSDGLFSGGVTSTALSTIDSRGCVWFTMINGVSSYDPSQINKICPPLVRVEEINTGKNGFLPSQQKITVPANNKRIVIDYTGLSYVSLERVFFRYQLLGFDSTPSALTSQRQVSYTNLKPGRYTFQVKAVNGDGIWSTEPAEITFIKEAYFYQHPIFLLSSLIFVGILVVFIFQLRMQVMVHQQEKLKKIIAEKTQALQDEICNSERLLLNVLPEPIALRLKRNDGVIADSFENVSVLFADIVGFTQLSSQCPPDELVMRLNDLFSRFDLRASKNGIEKIKTIGDAYMAVCGLPNENPDHALHLMEFARGMLKDITNFNKTSPMKFSMRIGINSGKVTAGVIGKTKFIYDVWGDTVNVASRMENCGKENTITVSETTYALTKQTICYSENDLVEVKGKGMMKVYRTI